MYVKHMQCFSSGNQHPKMPVSMGGRHIQLVPESCLIEKEDKPCLTHKN
jgi:hypothetical protein